MQVSERVQKKPMRMTLKKIGLRYKQRLTVLGLYLLGFKDRANLIETYWIMKDVDLADKERMFPVMGETRR